jgi:hypothetical protein
MRDLVDLSHPTRVAALHGHEKMLKQSRRVLAGRPRAASKTDKTDSRTVAAEPPSLEDGNWTAAEREERQRII